MITRRSLLVALASAPLASFAQAPGRVWKIGFLSIGPRPSSFDKDVRLGAFLQGMRDLGYVEGRNLQIEWRFAELQYDRLPGLAAEIVQGKPDLLVTFSTPGARAAQGATRTIPIVAAGLGDPIGSGLVKSLARPGGNLTGITPIAVDLAAKQIDVLKTTFPNLTRVAFLFNPDNPGNLPQLAAVEKATKGMGITLSPVTARRLDEIDSGFAAARQSGAQAMVIGNDVVFNTRTAQIGALAVKHRMPSIGPVGELAAAGALMSYGENLGHIYRRLAAFSDRVLKGANPADLPIEQPATVEFVINLKTAKALGVKIPQSILQRVDRVIE